MFYPYFQVKCLGEIQQSQKDAKIRVNCYHRNIQMVRNQSLWVYFSDFFYYNVILYVTSREISDYLYNIYYYSYTILMCFFLHELLHTESKDWQLTDYRTLYEKYAEKQTLSCQATKFSLLPLCSSDNQITCFHVPHK